MKPLAEYHGDALSAYPTRHRLIEAAAAAAFALLALWSLWRLAVSIDSASRLLLAGACALAGWVATDFLSGLGHWTFDTWGGIRTPFIGPWFVRPFREHHVDPKAITRHDFIETNGSCCLASLPALAVAALLPLDAITLACIQALLLFTALGVLVSNQCHKWAHADPARLGALVRGLQRLRLVLSPAQHRLHHRRPYDSHYCTASGWLNVPLEAIGFFRALEAAIEKALGTPPRHGGTR